MDVVFWGVLDYDAVNRGTGMRVVLPRASLLRNPRSGGCQRARLGN
jgi:hypothetical protein